MTDIEEFKFYRRSAFVFAAVNLALTFFCLHLHDELQVALAKTRPLICIPADVPQCDSAIARVRKLDYGESR